MKTEGVFSAARDRGTHAFIIAMKLHNFAIKMRYSLMPLNYAYPNQLISSEFMSWNKKKKKKIVMRKNSYKSD